MRIRNLELRARMVVEGFWHGLHRSPYHGFSVEFTEYRQYSPGDDPRYLDWRLVARTDRYYIKKFEDETNLRCHLLVDQSAARWPTARAATPRRTTPRTLAATLAYFLSISRATPSACSRSTKRCANTCPRAIGRAICASSCSRSTSPPPAHSTDLGAPLQTRRRAVRKRGLVVLISDLLAPIEALEAPLALLAAAGHEVLALPGARPRRGAVRVQQAPPAFAISNPAASSSSIPSSPATTTCAASPSTKPPSSPSRKKSARTAAASPPTSRSTSRSSIS